MMVVVRAARTTSKSESSRVVIATATAAIIATGAAIDSLSAAFPQTKKRTMSTELSPDSKKLTGEQYIFEPYF